MTLDARDLQTAVSALRAVRRALNLRGETSVAFDHALAALDNELTLVIAACGTPKPPAREADWVPISIAAKTLGLGRRRMRDLAPGIGGVKIGRDWMVPRDSLPEQLEEI